MAQVSIDPGGCWLWMGHKSRGYGYFWWSGHKRQAYRFAYITFKGPIPTGQELDHLCRNKGCVNPDLLELVTRSENNRRGLLGVLRKQAYCKHGHLYDEANTRINSRGHRICRACHRESGYRYIAAHKDQYANYTRKYRKSKKEGSNGKGVHL